MMMRAFACLIASVASALLWSCSPSDRQGRGEGEYAPALGARSAHAFVVLDEDGAPRDVLLTGIAGPDQDLFADAALQARAALDALIEGQALSISEAGEPDRYGRTPVQAQLDTGEDLAAALVEAGWAILWPRNDQPADFDRLRQAELTARRARAGGWAGDVFKVHSPDPNALAQRLDSAVIVRGRIVSTGEARNGRIYLNFGLNWRDDMTLSASSQVRQDFEEAGVTLESLDGAVIEARGWLYAENGPMIALTHPDQLAIIDAPIIRTRP